MDEFKFDHSKSDSDILFKDDNSHLEMQKHINSDKSETITQKEKKLLKKRLFLYLPDDIVEILDNISAISKEKMPLDEPNRKKIMLSLVRLGFDAFCERNPQFKKGN
jgi:hypothetical protein